MKKLYKTLGLAILAILLHHSETKSQEVPVPPTAPAEMQSPAPPPPPALDEKTWKDWGENFNKSFNAKEWKDLSKNMEKSFEGMALNFEDMNLASADFKHKMEKLHIRLKDLKVPVFPEMPAMPDFPVPLINNDFHWSSEKPVGAVEKSRKISKSYPVSSADQLAINNSYGRITVNTWDKSEFKVDVEIKAYAENEEDAQKLLDKVSVNSAKEGNQVWFKTAIESEKNGNWMGYSFWGKGSKQKIDVFYTVYMPSKNAISLKTNYTNIILPDMKGDVTVNLNYGDLATGKLDGKATIKSNYGKVLLASTDEAVVSANYGSLKVAESNNLTANLNYCNAELGKLSGSATFKMNYSGGFRIGSFEKNFKALNINANYSSINLDFKGSENFNFDIATTYASFKYDDTKVTLTSKTPSDEEKGWSSSKTYKGYYGKSSGANVVIRSNYGGVKFN